MWMLVLAGGWGTSAPARPGSLVDLLVAVLLAAGVWRLAERHQRELQERRDGRLVSFPAEAREQVVASGREPGEAAQLLPFVAPLADPAHARLQRRSRT